MRTGNLRLTLYGEGFYLSEWRAESTWQLPVFFDRYEEDMSVLTASLRKVHPRIYAYEIDAIRYHYAEYYYAAIAGLCRDLLEEIKESGQRGLFKRNSGTWHKSAGRRIFTFSSADGGARHGRSECGLEINGDRYVWKSNLFLRMEFW